MVENEDKGHDLVNDLKRSGGRVFYTIPKTALITERLGYETEQIIKGTQEQKLSYLHKRIPGKRFPGIGFIS